MNHTVNPVMTDSTPATLEKDLAAVEEAFSLAMISNDVLRISARITDDWVLVTPEAGVVPRARILHVIASGELSHDTMTKDVSRVRITDVYRRVDGRWLCVLTHLTPAASDGRCVAARPPC